jgi:hypothetical protein
MQVEEIEEAMKQSIAEDLAEKKISMRPRRDQWGMWGGDLREPYIRHWSSKQQGREGAHVMESWNPKSEQRKLELLEDPNLLELAKKEREDEKLQREVQRRKMA